MPSYTMVDIKMQRDSNATPWGFRMQGGRDFGCPIQIQFVHPNSLAERCGMCAGDYILRIGQVSTEHCQHREAQDYIKQHTNVLQLILQRGVAPTSADYNSRINFPAHQLIESNQTKAIPQPINPQVVASVSNNRAVVDKNFNSPMGLYSADNINDTISRTLQNINVGSDYRMEQSKALNEPKPASIKSIEQTYPKPFTPPVQSNVPIKPSPNTNKSGIPSIGNRLFKKNAKGSALLNQNENANQVATCFACGIRIRGPFISAIGHCYCVDHFTCSHCSINLMDCGFVEENGKLYCENDFEQYLAPQCAKCSQKILKECVHALEKSWHPECFVCTACKKLIGTDSFHVEEGKTYCVKDYQKLFQLKCTSCEFPIEAGDKYLEALDGIYHAECFTCSMCQVILDGHGFVVKNNKPYCRQHGRQIASLIQ